MTPADRLIVALDGKDNEIMRQVAFRLAADCGITSFKLRRGNFLRYGGWELARSLGTSAKLMIDLKDYDPRDSIDDSVRAAFDLGAGSVVVTCFGFKSK